MEVGTVCFETALSIQGLVFCLFFVMIALKNIDFFVPIKSILWSQK